jgi:hypothetical protein
MKFFYTLLFTAFISPAFGQHVTSTTVYFDFNKAEPNTSSIQSLNLFLEKISKLRITSVSIEGHTDKQGTNVYNENLSRARTESIYKLVAPNISKEVFITTTYRGEEKLVTAAEEQQAINRRVVIIVNYEEEPAIPPTKLEPFFEDVETQRFPVNLDDTIFITAREGTIIKIVPGSIQTMKGTLAKGKAEILIKEYYQPGDIIVSGLNTRSKQGLLQTGGMFRMVVVQGTDTMATKTKKPVEMKLPAAADSYGNMNVYTMNRPDGGKEWDKTGDVFVRTSGVWQWPRKLGNLENLVVPDIRFETWKPGHKYTDEYIAHETYWRFFDIPFGNRSDVNKVTNVIEKVDSVTLRATVKASYRKKGIKKYGTKYFDTSFLVKYKRAEYIGMPSTINWINCDRFLENRNPMDFYVTTPSFEGANVVVYFSSLRACMQADANGYTKYSVKQVPAGEKIWIIAFGKKNGEYYVSKKKFTTEKGLTASLDMDKVPEAEFRKMLKLF